MLDQVNSPDDLRALSTEELGELAGEIRAFIVEAVARTGGHLGSNLGAVELTIALHRVFRSPQDVLLWDTGHQAYVHKILTGRRDRFGELRQAGGLSGYPSRAESPHDWIENSHASTALAYAFGLSYGRGEDDAGEIVAVVGDGALTGGMAYEALNNIGHAGLPITIVLNDNGRSYAHTVSRLSSGVARLRFHPGYRSWRRRMDRALDHVPFAERLADAGIEALKTAVSEAPALQSFVEALGIRYSGPVDGHDVAAMERALRMAADHNGPVLVHALTTKGRGYEPAETDPEKCLHDTSAFDIATGRSLTSRPPTWTQRFSETLVDLADEHPEIVALTAAMPGSTGLLPLAERDPERVIDVGIAEQHAVTASAGLAMAGRIPILAVYSTFLARAFDQANLDVGLHDEHVIFALDRAGITGSDGPSHHGVLDMALCLRIPAMTVMAPSSGRELERMLRHAVDLSGPVSIRYPKGAATEIAATEEPLEWSSSRRLREGGDVCLISIGDRLAAALEAADALAADGIDVAVWDARVIRPADPTLVAAAGDASLVVTVENGVVSGGAGAYLADRVVELVGPRSAPPILRLGVPDAYIPQGSVGQILSELGLDADGIAAATRKALGRT